MSEEPTFVTPASYVQTSAKVSFVHKCGLISNRIKYS